MDQGLSLQPVPLQDRKARLLDVALIWAGANIVASTLVTGGTLGVAFPLTTSVILLLSGVFVGSGALAFLARLGPRYGLPTMVVIAHPFGIFGAKVISAALILTNFAWIAFNNQVAADALYGSLGGSKIGWNLGVASIAVAIALLGPRAMALFDRFAVPIMVVVALVLSYALLSVGWKRLLALEGNGSMSLLAGFDLIVGYEVSWSLMFADYTRYQRRESKASMAILLGLGLSSLWMMGIGAGAGALGGGNDPTQMILGLGLPGMALIMVALSTITTNFVNIYLSSLALKNLQPRLRGVPTVLTVGIIGTTFGLIGADILNLYGNFMGLIATLMLPTIGVIAVHFFGLPKGINPLDAPSWRGAALIAWIGGALVYQGLEGSPWGATLPCLSATALLYFLLRRFSNS